MFEESPNTKESIGHFTRVFGQYLAPLGHARVLNINSAGCPFPPSSGIYVMPSREFKSKLSDHAQKFFSRNRYLDLSGDETLHGLKEAYGQEVQGLKFDYLVNLHGKCVMIDESNLTFEAMNTRSRYRLLATLSKLYSDGYADYKSEIGSFRLWGRISFVFNVVSELFAKTENVIRLTTLGQRSLIAYGWLKDEEKVHIRENYRKYGALKPKIRLDEPYTRTIKNMGEYRGELTSLAKDYAILGVRNLSETLEIVEAIASSNARFNFRNYLCDDDIKIVRMLRGYNINPHRTTFVMVVGFLKEGRSFRDICHLLGKPYPTYKSTISHYKRLAEDRGLLDYGIERPEWWREVEGVRRLDESDLPLSKKKQSAVYTRLEPPAGEVESV